MPADTRPLALIGGAGFVGTSLARFLAQAGRPFVIIDRRPSRSFPERSRLADIRDAGALRAALAEAGGAGTAIHLAAVHRDDVRPRRLYREVNVEGTGNLIDAARALDIGRIVFASSVAVYGFAAPDTGEDGAIRPFNDYGRTKAEAESLLRAWQAEAPGRMLAIARPTVVFGEGNRGNVHTLLRQIASGRFAMIGDGRNRKSMAYVGNLAAFLARLAELDTGAHLYNYVDKPDFDMNGLVAEVRRTLLGKPGVGMRLPLWAGLAAGHLADAAAILARRRLPISAIRVKKFAATTAYSSRAGELPGWRPPVSLAEALARTLRHEFLEPDPEAETFETE